jgi:hydroxymethylglutaryl-CoA reductase (NADPH)
MTIDHRSASATLEELLRSHTTEELLAKLAPKLADPAIRLPRAPGTGEEEIAKRWSLLPNRESGEGVLLDSVSAATAPLYARNVENFIGTVRLPVGVAGPLRVNGTYAQGDFYVPLATTEAALVASYSRGAQIISEAGGT